MILIVGAWQLFLIILIMRMMLKNTSKAAKNLCFPSIFSVLLKFIFPKMERVNSHSMEKNMVKQKHLKVKGFLNISREAEIHAIPIAWDE